MKKENMIIYQLALRTFTPEGTLNAAVKLIPYLASLDIDIVYVCPFFVEENDDDIATWSPRQIASGTNNPKNPYKIADYFHVDSEYGTDEDLKAFVDEAHANGLLIMFDLVYLHCGKNAVFIQENPNFVIRDEKGNTSVGETWPFARLNFESRELREYLIGNMEYLLTEYGVDGFRCDVGDGIPLDFWDEAHKHIYNIKPDLIMLNEGVKPEYLENVFDMEYGFEWNSLMIKIFTGEASARELKELYIREQETYGKNTSHLIRTIDTHDIASNAGLNRNEIIMTSKGVEAALVITNTFDGVSFIWNGYDVCDNNENCMFSNREHGRRSSINWSRAFTQEGLRRNKLIKAIHSLHHNSDAVVNGKFKWIENNAPDEVISYCRYSNRQKLLIVVNSKNKAVKTELLSDINPVRIVMSGGARNNGNTIDLDAYGYIIAEA
ncbi:MAG: hypothetical protein J6N52_02625 [Clostridia bacterium]|nr:hypothetical protein [Clostridia bacterium]